MHIDFFCPDELAAQRVVRMDDEVFTHDAPRVAIVGTGAFGRAVLVEFARQRLIRSKQSPEPLSVYLIGPEAPRVAKLLWLRYPFIQDVCHVRTPAELPESFFRDPGGAGGTWLDRLYLCQEDEGSALKSALESFAHLQSVGTIVVRLDRMSGMVTSFGAHTGGDALFDALGGRLRIVDVAEEACDAATLGYDLAEGLARSVHQRYLLERLVNGDVRGSVPALVDWEELSEDLRAANRGYAIDIGRKMALINCLLVPRTTRGQDFTYQRDEVELLARREHERWIAERFGRGWRPGPVRDDVRRIHPDLVAWEHLSPAAQQSNRESILALPELLAEIGLAVVRVGRPLSPRSVAA